MFTKPFSKLSKKDADIAGGKGASLGEMLNAGIPVPDGFVVLSTTFDEFLHKADLIQEIDAILESVDHKAVHSIDAASEKIQELIKHAEMPEDIKSEIESEFKNLDSQFVAVRSSATAEDGADHAWAGQLESYLNTTQDTLLEKVQHCWASLFTPRAIFYRFEKGLHTTKISVAVVVQKMVNSEKSGIAFSVHPVTEDRNQIIIEAGFGLGEAIVSGSVTPDSYVVSKQPREIIDINISNQTRAMYRKAGGGNEWLDISEKGNTQVFIDSEILALSEIIMTIENHYGFPCDIEWAYEGGKFYVVQSRPITTLSEVVGPKISFEKAYTRDITMIIQQGWNACVTNPFYASGTNPFTPPFIHYMNDGVIEIWENEKATQWIMDSVQDLIKSDEAKLISLVDQYEKDLVEIKEYWTKGPITDIDEFGKYVDQVFVVMKGFDCMYFPSVDERTPAHIRERMLKLCDADTYFDSNDKLMRASLIALYPELKGYENCILKSEIKNPPSLEILKARKKSFVVIGEEFAEQTTIREYLAKHPEYHFHIEIPPADSSTLIGQVGNKGYAKGIVRIMKRKEQISEAQDGDIIVSIMTTPDFVPAMQKAAAIITDEGGITCHAAIVARELNKPCVIGTKFATEILKDGDEVEVDADNGIVRILNKTQEENLIDKFLLKVDKSDIYPFNGSFSPLLTLLAWSDPSLKGRYESSFPILMINKGRETFAVISESEYKKPAKKVLTDIMDGNVCIEDLKSEYLPLYELANKKYEFISHENIKELSEDVLVKELKENKELLSKIIARTLFIETLDYNILSHEVKNVQNLENVWEKSTHPHFESFELRRRKIIKSTLDEFGVSEKSIKDLMFIFTDYFKPKSFNEVKQLIQLEVDSEIPEKENAQDFIDWRNNLAEIEKRVVDYIQYVMEARDIRKDPIAKIQYNLYSIACVLAEKAEISEEHTVYLTSYEYQNGVSWLRDNKDLICKRKNGQILFLNETEEISVSLSGYQESVSEFMEKTGSLDKNTKVLHGQSASKGIIKGNVRIILDAHNTNNVFNQGDILITSMTRPEFVPLMKLAGAVVTNEGGVTCHAAIISRELGIPCVIGTKFATQIFKDGDIVEVDANKGIVRIII